VGAAKLQLKTPGKCPRGVRKGLARGEDYASQTSTSTRRLLRAFEPETAPQAGIGRNHRHAVQLHTRQDP
jgi:hypothetical protein